MATEALSATIAPAAISDYIALLKPRVMSLVVFSGLAGIVLAPGTLHPLLAAACLLWIALGSGAVGGINMWLERDSDALMTRTQNRPLPAGRIEPQAALEFSVVLAIAAPLLMALTINWVAAFWLAVAELFYVFVYTVWLKRRTPQNIVIGGAAGAFPPVIGWAAVSGDTPLAPWVLFAIIFFWTPPHFWALALYRCKDYARAGIPMLPVVAGDAATKWQMLVYTVLLLPISLLPTWLGFAGLVYGAVALVLGAVFIAMNLRLLFDSQNRTAPAMFSFSLLYLSVLLATLIGERWAA